MGYGAVRLLLGNDEDINKLRLLSIFLVLGVGFSVLYIF